jgi:hypothetical protein
MRNCCYMAALELASRYDLDYTRLSHQVKDYSTHVGYSIPKPSFDTKSAIWIH